MLTPFPITDDVILEADANRLLITNLYAEKEITVRLPSAYSQKSFEVLLLSKFPIVLHTNSEVYQFLAATPTKKLRLGGSMRSVGRTLTIETYDTYWRIVSTSIPDIDIQFKE
jgi:hypothetical protein